MDATRLPEGIIIESVLTIARPVDTIVRDTVTGQLFASTNALVATYTQLTSPAGALFKSVAQTTVNTNPEVFALASAEAGDIVFATIQIDDTGGTLGAIIGAVGAPGTISILFENAPTNNDGIVNILVFDGTP